MLTQSLDTLNKTAPPAPGKRFLTYKAAASRIAALEKELGLPKGEPQYNIGAANARIRELEAILANRPAAAAIPVPAAAAAAAAPAPFTPTPHLVAAAKNVFGNLFGVEVLSETRQRQHLAARFAATGLRYPGCDADFAALPEDMRPRIVGTLNGSARSAIATSQAIVNKSLTK